jgi:hypothetical protein
LLGSYQPNVARWINGRPLSRRVCEDIRLLFERERDRHIVTDGVTPPSEDGPAHADFERQAGRT